MNYNINQLLEHWDKPLDTYLTKEDIRGSEISMLDLKGIYYTIDLTYNTIFLNYKKELKVQNGYTIILLYPNNDLMRTDNYLNYSSKKSCILSLLFSLMIDINKHHTALLKDLKQ